MRKLYATETDLSKYFHEISEKSPEISDYTDYEMISTIKNVLEINDNLCNNFLECV
jgi:hypothetical protein